MEYWIARWNSITMKPPLILLDVSKKCWPKRSGAFTQVVQKKTKGVKNRSGISSCTKKQGASVIFNFANACIHRWTKLVYVRLDLKQRFGPVSGVVHISIWVRLCYKELLNVCCFCFPMTWAFFFLVKKAYSMMEAVTKRMSTLKIGSSGPDPDGSSFSY